jgi:hypothetical protein
MEGDMTDTIGNMKVTNVIENEDGSATYTFELDDKATQVVHELGLKLILYCGVTGTDIDYVFKSILGETDD